MTYIVSSQNVRIEQQSASIGARAGALLIDLIIMGGLDYLFTIMHLYDLFDHDSTIALGFIIYFLPWIYPVVSETFLNGQTFGKKVFHMRVVTLEGGGPKLTSLILRWLMLPIDLFFACGIGEMCVFFTERQQRLGDIIAGTWVVKTQTYETDNINLNGYNHDDNYQVEYPKAKNLKPSQALVIADAIDASDSPNVRFALLDLSRKVENIVGKSHHDDITAFLTAVLNDYRYDEKMKK